MNKSNVYIVLFSLYFNIGFAVTDEDFGCKDCRYCYHSKNTNVNYNQKLSSNLPKVILGTDDRVPSNDPRVGRIYPIGCTAWLVSNGCILTAGHCANSPERRAKFQFLEFNVPPSLPDGTMVNADIQNRYPIIINSLVHFDPQKGDDYCIFKVNRNINNESVFDRQSASFRIVNKSILDFIRTFYNNDQSGPVLRITGHGKDNQPPGPVVGNDPPYFLNSKNRTQQTDSGLFRDEVIGAVSDVISYYIDTLNGNSGSPVYLEGTQLAIGIHEGGDSNSNDYNIATGFNNPNLVNNMYIFLLPYFNLPLNTVLTYVDSDYSAFSITKKNNGITGDGGMFSPYRKLEDAVEDAPDGATLALTKGYYANAGIEFYSLAPSKKISIMSVGGKVYIGGRPLPL